MVIEAVAIDGKLNCVDKHIVSEANCLVYLLVWFFRLGKILVQSPQTVVLLHPRPQLQTG